MRNRRGLSTIVGAVFFIIAATTVISYISYSMNSIDQFSQSVIVAEAENINRGIESISISQVTIVGGEFNMTVINTGSLPVKITRLWVTEKDSDVSDKKADLTNVIINTGNKKYNIGQGTGIAADSSVSYTLKVITERGNVATFSVSPDIPLQIQLIAPANAGTNENLRVIAIITNNSTIPNNVANLVPELLVNMTLTQVNGPIPPSIQSLPQGNTATFTWTFQAPITELGISFNGSYAGAPTGSFVFSNTTVTKSFEASEAGTSEWSQAAKRVGLLISGVPNPIEASGASYWGKWGIGIINPLDRPVEIYSVGILSVGNDIFWQTPIPVEPITGWTHDTLGDSGIIIWEGGAIPVIIPAKDVGQFRVESKFKVSGTVEAQVLIQALTSEGKMTTIYTITANPTHPTINTFYTTDPTDALNNWGYMIKGLQPGKTNQIFNATIENAADNDLNSIVKLLVLIPSDFTNVLEYSGGNPGWETPSIVKNPDDSHIITVDTSSSPFLGETYKTFQFTADVPLETEKKLYVFQTTTIYPSFTGSGEIELASALSEAGVQVLGTG